MYLALWALVLSIASSILAVPTPSFDSGVSDSPQDVLVDAHDRPTSLHDTNPIRRPTRSLPTHPTFRSQPIQDDEAAEPPGCSKQMGVVRARVVAGEGVEAIGYVGRRGNVYGEYEIAAERGQAMTFRLPACPEVEEGETAGEVFGMETLDGFADFGFFGGTTGYENWGRDLKRGTADFVYLVGTGQEPRGAALPAANSFAQATYLGPSPAQSEMWTLDLQNGRLLPVWTNADGRIADATIVYVPHSRAFVLVGDMDVYKKIYGDAWETTFTFEDMTFA